MDAILLQKKPEKTFKRTAMVNVISSDCDSRKAASMPKGSFHKPQIQTLYTFTSPCSKAISVPNSEFTITEALRKVPFFNPR